MIICNQIAAYFDVPKCVRTTLLNFKPQINGICIHNAYSRYDVEAQVSPVHVLTRYVGAICVTIQVLFELQLIEDITIGQVQG